MIDPSDPLYDLGPLTNPCYRVLQRRPWDSERFCDLSKVTQEYQYWSRSL